MQQRNYASASQSVSQSLVLLADVRSCGSTLERRNSSCDVPLAAQPLHLLLLQTAAEIDSRKQKGSLQRHRNWLLSGTPNNNETPYSKPTNICFIVDTGRWQRRNDP